MEFDTIARELQELQKDNDALKKPMDLNVDENKSESVKQDQKEALEEYDKEQGNEESDDNPELKEQQNKIDQKQRSAARKMKEMSESLSQSGSSMGGGSSIAEDAEMLRQILDNLVTFSFKQEELLDVLTESDGILNDFGGVVREQQQLKELFEHVDDSLFALSLRRAELSEFVNEQITEVYYNIDKTLASVSENKIFQGASYQQYVLTASNNLADYLASILDNMQQSLSMGSGQGSGESFQLPDIIQSQSELKEKMGKMQGEGQQGRQEGESQEGQSQGDQKGKEGNEGEEGEEGESEGENEGEGSEGNKGKGSKEGDGDSEGGNGTADENEEDLQELFEIYKEQQRIRQELEKQLEDMIENGDRDLAKKLLRQMESFEEDLLENGITQRTIQRMNMIEHQLLKLENAALDQGEKQERQGRTNREDYSNPILTRPEQWENFKRETELLNRQALPLQQRYRELIRLYFKSDD